MKKFFLVLILTFLTILSFAQQNHFIYLQTENKQPFYIKLDDKILSSSASGYLIISKLKDGVYKLIIGFPKNEWPEQQLNCKVDKKDAGYVIKNFPGKGWGLYNLQTSGITMAGDVIVNNETTPQEKQDDVFSTTLANVVNDSTILQKDIVKEEPKEKPVEIKSEKSNEQNNIPVVTTPEAKSVITRKIKKNNKNGMELMYVDEYNNEKDTIRIFIPFEKIEKEKKLQDSNILSANQPVTIIPDKVAGNKVADSLETKQAQKNDEKKSNVEVVIIPKQEKKDSIAVQKPLMINSDCKRFASENDFIKLRKKMAAENSDENMIRVAKKFFKTKCFTADYIKNLSVLFLKDEGKYMFFDAAYAYVSDSDMFYTLENQLTDSYYINRFKAMIHK